jgi:hypothetical protein
MLYSYPILKIIMIEVATKEKGGKSEVNFLKTVSDKILLTLRLVGV